MPYRIIWSGYTGHWLVGCYIWYSEEGTKRGGSPHRPLLVVPNVTAHPLTASVPIAVLLYGGPLLCGFNVAIRRLNWLTVFRSCYSLFCAPQVPDRVSWRVSSSVKPETYERGSIVFSRVCLTDASLIFQIWLDCRIMNTYCIWSVCLSQRGRAMLRVCQ